jgi:hypothetical protein
VMAAIFPLLTFFHELDYYNETTTGPSLLPPPSLPSWIDDCPASKERYFSERRRCSMVGSVDDGVEAASWLDFFSFRLPHFLCASHR